MKLVFAYHRAFDPLPEQRDFLSGYDRGQLLTILQNAMVQRFPSSIQRVVGDPGSQSMSQWYDDLRSLVQDETLDPDDGVVLLWADSPLYDASLTEAIVQLHHDQGAQFTFADGYPEQLIPQVLRVEIIEQMERLVHSSMQLSRNPVFDLLSKDINNFDLETMIAPKDWRQLRLELNCQGPVNTALVQGILDRIHGSNGDTDVLTILAQEPQLVRTLPAVAYIQLLERCPHSCPMCVLPILKPNHKESEARMDMDTLERVLDGFASLNPQGVVVLSAMGELSLFPDLEQLWDRCAAHPDMEFWVETSGLGWQRDQLERGFNTLGTQLQVIVSLDGPEEPEYQKLRGSGFAEADDFAHWLVENYPRQSYVQVIRTDTSEAMLLPWVRHWEKLTDNFIIQKFSTFGRRIADRSATKFAPFERFPCWHIKRELHIDLQGRVHRCRETWGKEVLNLTFGPENAREIWESMADWHQCHIEEDYPKPCKDCDEFYTFTF